MALDELGSTVHNSSLLLVHNDIATLNPTAAYVYRSIFSAVQEKSEAVKTLDRHLTNQLDSIVDKVDSIEENVDSIGAKVDNLGQDVNSLRQDVDNHLGQNIDNLPEQNVSSIGQLFDSLDQRLAAHVTTVTAKIDSDSTGHNLNALHKDVVALPHQAPVDPLPSGFHDIAERQLRAQLILLAQNEVILAQNAKVLERLLSNLRARSERPLAVSVS